MNKDFSLIKEGNKYIIEFNSVTDNSIALIKSLTKTRIIQGATVTKDFKTLKFQAHTVTTLETFFSDKKATIPQAAQILETLARQLNYLLQYESKTILGYAANQILLINEETPAFLGLELVADVAEGTNLATISGLFDTKEFFAAPELFKIKVLPSQVHFKVSYYSLACLIINLLLGSDEFYTYNNNQELIIKHLDTHHIKDTKLYWLLSRCLLENPNKRSIIFI
jgi:serine/threonine protein kinase